MTDKCEGACDSGGSQEPIKEEYIMCTWHCCRLPRIEGDRYCESHARLAAIERAELDAAMAKVKR